MKIKTLGMAALLLVGASGAQAQSFDVSDIRVEGLQRVSAASVFNAFPVSANDRVSEQQLAAGRHLCSTVYVCTRSTRLLHKYPEVPTADRY